MTWPVVPLGEVARIQGGIQKQPKRAPKENPHPFLRVANVTAKGLDLQDVHSIELFDGELERYRLERGDLLVVEGNGSAQQIGRAAVWDGSIADAVHQNHLIRIRPGPSIDARFLGLVWNAPAIRQELTDVASSSSGLHTLSVAKLKRIKIPFPDLHEQHRIVDLLEDHLSRLDAANAGIGHADRKAMALQWSALNSAIRETGGEPVSLGELASVKNGIYVSRPAVDPDGVPILRIGAIRSLRLDLSDLRYSALHESEIDSMGGLLESGDLLFTRYNGNPRFVGACAVVTDALLPLTYPDKLIRVRPDTERVVPEFLAVACSVGSARAQIQAAVKTTSGQAGISGRDLKAVEVSLPSLQDQEHIARLSTDVVSATKRLESTVATLRIRATTLRRSLLAAAFSGELTDRSVKESA